MISEAYKVLGLYVLSPCRIFTRSWIGVRRRAFRARASPLGVVRDILKKKKIGKDRYDEGWPKWVFTG